MDTAAALAVVNGRLKKGEGSIGYRYSKNSHGQRAQSKSLYFSFYQNGKQKFILTKTNDPEQAYRDLLEARGQVRDGVRLLPQEVSKLRYEDLRQILVDHYREHYPSAIKDSINWRRKKGHKDATIRRQLTPLRSAFQRAKDLDLLTDNHIPSFVLPRDSEPREGFLEPEDFNLILERLPVHLKPAAMFMYFTGARKGSVKKVTWSMVSKDNTQITMPGRINKNRKPHVIPLVGPLEPIVNMLAEMRKSFPRPEDHVFDFTNHRNIWNQVCAELGFGQYDKKTRKYTGLLMHDFRRSAARNLLKMGVRKELAKRITGHLTDEMSDRYAIQTTDDVREALIKVGKYRPETAARSG